GDAGARRRGGARPHEGRGRSLFLVDLGVLRNGAPKIRSPDADSRKLEDRWRRFAARRARERLPPERRAVARAACLAGGGWIARRSLTMVIRDGVPFASMTTLAVGGEARFFVDAGDEQTVLEALEWASKNGVTPTILGGGSNVLVSDRGVNGLVVRIRI